MKSLFFILSVSLLTGCKIANTISLKRDNKNRLIYYSLFYNNRTASHIPKMIVVQIDSFTNSKEREHKLYQFYLTSNEVKKIWQQNRKRNEYLLIIDTLATENDLPNNNNELFPISQFESGIFETVIFYSDSLGLKDFKYLNNAKGFKIIPTN
jgi:hypothetical protein